MWGGGGEGWTMLKIVFRIRMWIGSEFSWVSKSRSGSRHWGRPKRSPQKGKKVLKSSRQSWRLLLEFGRSFKGLRRKEERFLIQSFLWLSILPFCVSKYFGLDPADPDSVNLESPNTWLKSFQLNSKIQQLLYSFFPQQIIWSTRTFRWYIRF